MDMEAMEIRFPLVFKILDVVYSTEILFGATHLLEAVESVEKFGMKKVKC